MDSPVETVFRAYLHVALPGHASTADSQRTAVFCIRLSGALLDVGQQHRDDSSKRQSSGLTRQLLDAQTLTGKCAAHDEVEGKPFALIPALWHSVLLVSLLSHASNRFLPARSGLQCVFLCPPAAQVTSHPLLHAAGRAQRNPKYGARAELDSALQVAFLPRAARQGTLIKPLAGQTRRQSEGQQQCPVPGSAASSGSSLSHTRCSLQLGPALSRAVPS